MHMYVLNTTGRNYVLFIIAIVFAVYFVFDSYGVLSNNKSRDMLLIILRLSSYITLDIYSVITAYITVFPLFIYFRLQLKIAIVVTYFKTLFLIYIDH